MAFTNLASNLGKNGSSTGVNTVSGAVQVVIHGTFGTDGASGAKPTLMIYTSTNDTDYVPIAGSAVKEPASYILDLGTGAYVKAVVFGGDSGTSISVEVGPLP